MNDINQKNEIKDVPVVKYVETIQNPGKPFLACDMELSAKFADPYFLLYELEYDRYGVNKDGLYAVGGTLSEEMLMKSYEWGIFPWFPYKCQKDVIWYCPRDRYVIFPEKIHVSHSLRNLFNKNKYRVTINQAFEKVIRNCACVNGRNKEELSWLSDNIIEGFMALHRRGLGKSVEIWNGEKLVGGFYGFFKYGVFQGESMFSLEPSASQYGLVSLCKNPELEGEKVKLIDTQFETPTFARLGGEYLPYRRYREIMGNVSLPTH